jgi:hypothetical protein
MSTFEHVPANMTQQLAVLPMGPPAGSFLLSTVPAAAGAYSQQQQAMAMPTEWTHVMQQGGPVFCSRTRLRANAPAYRPGVASHELAMPTPSDTSSQRPHHGRQPAQHRESSKTSVVLQNLPKSFMRDELLELLQEEGLQEDIDFLYVPVDLLSKSNYRFAFLNFATHKAAKDFMKNIRGFRSSQGWEIAGEESAALEVSWCEGIQGLHKYVERYRNSRIMHWRIDDEYKPALYKNGKRIPFPQPTKDLRLPRIRKFGDQEERIRFLSEF